MSADTRGVGACEVEHLDSASAVTTVASLARAEEQPLGDAPTARALSRLARSHLRCGRLREAERISDLLHEGLLSDSRAGKIPLTSDVVVAVDLALRLAELSGDGAWLNAVFDLFAVLHVLPDLEQLLQLRALIGRARGVSVTSYRRHVDRLEELQSTFNAAQRQRWYTLLALEELIVDSFLTCAVSAGLDIQLH